MKDDKEIMFGALVAVLTWVLLTAFVIWGLLQIGDLVAWVL